MLFLCFRMFVYVFYLFSWWTCGERKSGSVVAQVTAHLSHFYLHYSPLKNFCGNIFSRTVKREISLLKFSLDKPRGTLSYPCPFTFDCQKVHNHHHHIQIIWLTKGQKIDSIDTHKHHENILRKSIPCLLYLKLPRRPITNTFGWWRHHLARCQIDEKFHTFPHLSPITKK